MATHGSAWTPTHESHSGGGGGGLGHATIPPLRHQHHLLTELAQSAAVGLADVREHVREIGFSGGKDRRGTGSESRLNGALRETRRGGSQRRDDLAAWADGRRSLTRASSDGVLFSRF